MNEKENLELFSVLDDRSEEGEVSLLFSALFLRLLTRLQSLLCTSLSQSVSLWALVECWQQTRLKGARATSSREDLLTQRLLIVQQLKRLELYLRLY